MSSPASLDPPPAEGGPVPRHEFRHFGASLGAVRGRLRDFAGSEAGEVEEREDLYIVARGQVGAVLKLRDGVLDLKLLRGRTDALELWEPSCRMDFPIPARALEEFFLTPAALILPLPDPLVSAERFLAAVGETPGIRAITVLKRRERFRIGAAEAEHGRIEVRGRTFETVAVEGEDPAEVARLVREIGLSDTANVSYQRLLHALSFE